MTVEMKNAIKHVHDFLSSKDYEGERIIWNGRLYKGKISIEMMEPNGIFIVDSDGNVEDNYGVFT